MNTSESKAIKYDKEFYAERNALIEQYSKENDPDICCCGGSVSVGGVSVGCGGVCRSAVEYHATREAEQNLKLRTAIEQRPHPCATKCPNFTDEQCCHCLVGA